MFKKGKSPESAFESGADVNSVSSVMENIVFSEQQKLEDLNKLIKKLEEMEAIKNAELQNLHEEKEKLEDLKVKTQKMLQAAIQKKEEEKNQAIAEAKQQLDNAFEVRKAKLEQELQNHFEQKMSIAREEFYATEKVRIEEQCRNQYEAALEQQYSYITSEFNKVISHLGGFKSTIDSSFGGGVEAMPEDTRGVSNIDNVVDTAMARPAADYPPREVKAPHKESPQAEAPEVSEEALKAVIASLDAVEKQVEAEKKVEEPAFDRGLFEEINLESNEAFPQQEPSLDFNDSETAGLDDFAHLQGLLGDELAAMEDGLGSGLDLDDMVEDKQEMKLDNLIDFDEIQYRSESVEAKEKAAKKAPEPVSTPQTEAESVPDSYKELVKLQEERMEKILKMMQE